MQVSADRAPGTVQFGEPGVKFCETGAAESICTDIDCVDGETKAGVLEPAAGLNDFVGMEMTNRAIVFPSLGVPAVGMAEADAPPPPPQPAAKTPSMKHAADAAVTRMMRIIS